MKYYTVMCCDIYLLTYMCAFIKIVFANVKPGFHIIRYFVCLFFERGVCALNASKLDEKHTILYNYVLIQTYTSLQISWNWGIIYTSIIS